VAASRLDEVAACSAHRSPSGRPGGYSALLDWLTGFGPVTKGGASRDRRLWAGVARFLARAGIEVIEIDRQNRQDRRAKASPIPSTPFQAARAALPGRADGRAKSRDGAVEAIRVLVVAKRSARQARVKAIVQMRQLHFHRPRPAAKPDQRSSDPKLVAVAQGLRPDEGNGPSDRGHQGNRCRHWPPGRRPRGGDHPARRDDHSAAARALRPNS